MKFLTWSGAILIACTAPAAAQTIPPVPFHTNYTYWDHHWLQWTPTHQRFEAIEASVAALPDGRSITRVWLTDRTPPKRQVFYFDDGDMAAAMRTGESHHAPLQYKILGADGTPRGLDLHFRDAAGEPVSWRLGFAPDAKLSSEFAGLKPQGGHSAAEVFLLFVLGPNATTWDSVAMIGDRAFAVTPDTIKSDGRYYGAAYTAGTHNGVFNYGTRPMRMDALNPRIAVARDANGAFKSLRHSFGKHDMTLSVSGDRYEVRFDGAAPVLTGKIAADGSDILWRPEEPGWARDVVLRSRTVPFAGGYELGISRASP
jgi:hypothetical protein